jgi:hypothetical protein
MIMMEYIVCPRGAEWRVSSQASEEVYTYKKRSAAISMAESLASDEDTIAVYRFDGEFLERIE